MKKLLLLATLAFALCAGTATVMTVHPHWVADCGSGGCSP